MNNIYLIKILSIKEQLNLQTIYKIHLALKIVTYYKNLYKIRLQFSKQEIKVMIVNITLLQKLVCN